MPVVPSGALLEFSTNLARRLGAAQLFVANLNPWDSFEWSLYSEHAGHGRTTRSELPSGLPGAFATISLDRAPGIAGWNHLRRITECTSGSLLMAPCELWDGAEPDGLVRFRSLLSDHGLSPDFIGLHGGTNAQRRLVAIFSQVGRNVPVPPHGFRVIALITAFNEEDIIVQVISHLAGQGVEVILIDNWSTDATVERASSLLGQGLIRIDRFPAGGPTSSFDLTALLQHEADIAATETADWFIHHDADEIRRSPWPDRTLREAFYLADHAGFNAVDHTQLDFQPTDDNFAPERTLEESFRYFAPASVIAQDYRVNAWKKTAAAVNLDSSGGHSVRFEGRRVFPYNFLLKHYPIRSQAHGERKVLRERKPRWNPEERKRGWHFQYDHIRKGHQFIKAPEELLSFGTDFNEAWVVERLGAVGLHSEPARYSWRSRRLAINTLRRLGLLGPALRAQRRLRAALRRDVSLGQR